MRETFNARKLFGRFFSKKRDLKQSLDLQNSLLTFKTVS